MIFYYTGTGNSLEAATLLAEEDEVLIDIGACCMNETFHIENPEGERIGFCFPVYFGGLPIPVQKFFDEWELANKPGFIFAVLICGSTTFAASDMLEKRLQEKGLAYKACYAVKMPDNYVVMYALSSKSEQAHTLMEARTRLKMIKGELREEKEIDIITYMKDKNATRMMYNMYKNGKKTSKFLVKDKCTGCGLCVTRCQDRAIEMVDGRPTWVKDRCSHCMACMRCDAITYGGRTDGRDRYENPILKEREKAAEKAAKKLGKK